MKIFLFILPLLSQPEKINILIEKGLEASYVEDYQKSRLYYDSIVKLYPEHPAGYFYKAALLQLYMMDFVTDSKEKDYFRLMKRTQKICKLQLKKDKYDKWANFFYGSSLVFTTIYQGWHRRYWKAFTTGISAYDYMKRVVKKDRFFYDAYLLLGAYDYFSGRVSKYLLGIKPFGSIKQGIEELKLVKNKGRFYNITATQALSWIYTEEKNYKNAILLAKALVNKYPHGRTFRWQYAASLSKAGKIEEAFKVYTNLIKDIKKYQNGNITNISQCNLEIAKLYLKKNDTTKAKIFLKKVLIHKKDIRRDLGYSDIVKEANKLIKRISH